MTPQVSRLSEDWLAVGIGLSLFLLSLAGLAGVDLFGWAVKTNVWLAPGKIMTPVSARKALPARSRLTVQLGTADPTAISATVGSRLH